MEDTLHLAAKIRMAGSVYNVDPHPLIIDGSILGQDGDAPFPFQVAAIHDPLLYLLIGPENAALAQKLVHQGGFAMVHVGDDGNIADVFVGHIYTSIFKKFSVKAQPYIIA